VTDAPRIHPAAAHGYAAATDQYERGRPNYPADAVEHVVTSLEIHHGRTVLDLGAGTGKFTSLLVPTGATILAVEPVAQMRRVLVARCPDVEARDGTAESIPVADASVDAVVVAQAFHWFDGHRALAEIERVLRATGGLALIWNVRDETPAWSRALTALFDELSGDEAPRYKHGRWRQAFDSTEAFTPLEQRSFAHAHVVDREGFLDRVLSVSYVASASEAVRAEIVERVTALLDRDPDLVGRERLEMPYVTDVFVCEKR